MPKQNNLEKTLHETFGISHLWPGQQEVIQSVLQGHDTLAVMPTGSGKSLCYQLPGLHLPGTTLVVSPLISLMQDQADKLEEIGVRATQVNSTLSRQEEAQALCEIQRANSEIVLVTPERLSNTEFVTRLQQTPIDIFVVDEAHCISKWGHDFRPAYLELGNVLKALGQPRVLALTATATADVIDDIARQLGRGSMRVINIGSYRPNLHYQVLHVTSDDEKRARLLALVRETEGSGIIYTATVKAALALHEALKQAGESATLYHGRLAAKKRTHHQLQFMQGEARIMVATNAFGMGIDKSDIRFVIHFQMPGNLEAYYQESGRAGRDGKPAHCTLLYQLVDKRLQQFFLARHYPGIEEVNRVVHMLQKLERGGAVIELDHLREQLRPLANSKLQVTLKLLQDGGLLTRDAQLGYRLTDRNVSFAQLRRLADAYSKRDERDRRALERMVFYAQTGFCRWKVLLEYLGEKVEWEHCGSCDNCLQAPEQILAQLPKLPAGTSGRAAPAPSTLPCGATVQVAKYGKGQVLGVAGDKVTIVFPDSQQRIFLRSYVTLV